MHATLGHAAFGRPTLGRPTLAGYRPVAVDDLTRVGREHDGGYVISHRSLDAADLLVGMGINADWSFEADFLGRNPGARVIGIDGSVSPGVFRRAALRRAVKAVLSVPRGRLDYARAHLEKAREHAAVAREFERFWTGDRRFIRKFVMALDGARALSWATLRGQLEAAANGARPAVFVKMDIEGAEYDVLPHVLGDADAIVGMVVEFHDCGERWEAFTALMDRLQQSFAVVHVHGNNCTGLISGTTVPQTLEVSLVHRRLLRSGEEAAANDRRYPLAGLDQSNDPQCPDYPLEF